MANPCLPRRIDTIIQILQILMCKVLGEKQPQSLQTLMSASVQNSITKGLEAKLYNNNSPQPF
jgi:hypothetical protein